MKKIKLTQNKYALVDNSDFESLNQHKWFTKKNGKNFYAQRNGSIKSGIKRKIIGMHQQILGEIKGKEIDHKDCNGLNNQRKNLRHSTKIENQRNVKRRVDNTSGLKGISWDRSRKRWFVSVTLNKIQINLGRFIKLLDAKRRYRLFIKNTFGEFGRIK